ncbi:hypothetical protein [Candidatus Poriferisodalis sp.]|uniref:hypothetical protein n=1 Tax=Candidatus Poriferisodalis sp. TaxID=3101277 RepID=UPI003B02A469
MPQVEVSFGSGSYSVSEGSTVTVTVSLSAVPEREVTVRCRRRGWAAPTRRISRGCRRT